MTGKGLMLLSLRVEKGRYDRGRSQKLKARGKRKRKAKENKIATERVNAG